MTDDGLVEVRSLEGHNGRMGGLTFMTVDGVRSISGSGYQRHMFQVMPDRCYLHAQGDDHSECLISGDVFTYCADFIVNEEYWLRHGIVVPEKP